ncbi:MAG: choice-of-anchor L domain-containing protein, partial [Bacteroidia bacterium]
MQKFTRFFYLITIALFQNFGAQSQIAVTPNNTAASLAQAVAGVGVNVSNATINCGGSAAGTFSFSGANLGISGGIILTTGTAIDAANSGNHLCNINNGNNFSDPNLIAIVPTATFDVCVLEFDFIPTCDSLKMAFVFGSEEYPQGVGGYNDAFAIFLTGTNPSGGNYTAQNIATLPNGTPVSINNVNAGTNSAYFHNNYTTPNSAIAYNGYTIPITSITPVAPCSTYHVKFAIADAGNALYDSGVLISNNTLSCQSPAVLTTSTTATGGCGSTGSATVTVTNYTGTPTYHWYPGNQTTQSISGLASGTYTCHVSMNQICGIITQTVTALVGTTSSNIVLTSSQQNLICNGGTNASATVNPIGGAAPYNCIWNTSPVQTGFTATNLSAGTYTASVTDNGGCLSAIQITITAPPILQVSVSTTSTTCTGSVGTASVNVTANGTSPYSYSWNTSPVQTTQTATHLLAGNYTCIITDVNTCTVSAAATVTIQPINWNATATTTNVACYGGNTGVASVNINNGGNNSYSFFWNMNTGPTYQTASSLTAGNYTCTITDVNTGCIVTTTANITQPAILTATVNSLPTLCSGAVGSATTIASGGTQPYTYLWNTTQTTSAIHNLAQGQYTVTVKDAHNCTTTSVAIITISSPTLQITTSVVNSVCGGPSGEVNVISVTPAAAPYQYAWLPGNQTTQSITGLLPGTYSVSITDANGCMGSKTTTVGTNTFFPIHIATYPDYCGKNIGSATATPVANPPYTYQWSTTPTATTQTIHNVSTGNYTVVVTDGFNHTCKDSVTVAIGNTPSLTIQTNATPTFCNKNLGTATANPMGYSPYHYQWSTLDTNQTILNLSAGNYTVEVSDLYNCTATASVTVVNQNDVLATTFNVLPGGEIYSLTDVTLDINVNAGWALTSGYLSTGTNLELTTHYSFEQSGDYTASYYFTSNHGCIDSVTYNIHVIDYSTLYIPNSFSPNNDGRNDLFKAEGTFITSFEMYIYD